MKHAEFERIVRKLQLRTRKSGDRLAWFEYEGKTIVRTRRSEKKGDLSFSHAIRQQLKLDEDQMRDLIACPLDRDGYTEISRQEGLL